MAYGGVLVLVFPVGHMWFLLLSAAMRYPVIHVFLRSLLSTNGANYRFLVSLLLPHVLTELSRVLTVLLHIQPTSLCFSIIFFSFAFR
jgi:hypothetical protein